MRLKIISPTELIHDWDVTEVVVPTQAGVIWILPNHIPLTSIVKGWICKFKTAESVDDFLLDWWYCAISVWDGLVYTDWKQVLITVSVADISTKSSEEELEEMKNNLEKDIKDLKAKWSIEELDTALINMNKVLADIRLVKLKKRKM